jgi:SAM-dependent MidA family methyltransferase
VRELFVAWSPEGGSFVEVEATPSTPALEERLTADEIQLDVGQVAEICLAIDGWLDDVAAALDQGFATVVDYGYPARDLYAPARRAGTLSAYASHRVHDAVLRAVGRQDLTAHVDFTAIGRSGAARGWETLGLTSQAEFLVGSGLQELMTAAQSEPALEAEAYVQLRAAVMRLLDPRALGGFRVLVLGRRVPADLELRGLRYEARR